VGARGRLEERIFGSGVLLARKALLKTLTLSHMLFDGVIEIPFRTNNTPDQRAGSPGVRDTYIPYGHAYLRLVLSDALGSAWDLKNIYAYNSRSRFCFRTAERPERGRDTIVKFTVVP
jgi:hypothetical protein